MGAWDQFYRAGMQPDPGTPLAYAIVALKRELDFNGYGGGLSFGNDFGQAMRKQVIAFQHAQGLEPDGVIGPVTAKALYRKRFGILEVNFGVPDDIVCKACSLESAIDPGAVGVADPMDHGIMQINAGSHPEITIAEAFSPAFALDYYARALTSVHSKLNDWDGAIAAWNVGAGGASVWVGFHKPAHGGVTWFPDLFARATRYVALVRAEAC